EFISASYWDLAAVFDSPSGQSPATFKAKLAAVDGKKVASGNSFDSSGALTAKNVVHLDESLAQGLVAALSDSRFSVRKVESKPYTRRPYAPFRTTTMQQAASRSVGCGAARTLA